MSYMFFFVLDELGVNFSTPSYEKTNNSDKEVKKLSR